MPASTSRDDKPITFAAPTTPRGAGSTPTHVGLPLTIVLGLLTTFGPISMDLYLPVLPALAKELGAPIWSAQLTVSACLLGLAAGQIVAGPMSDRLGRRRPLLIGIAAYILTSVLCAVTQSIEVLIVVRFLQGLAGAVGIVIAQAAGRDLYSGTRLVRYYGRLTVLGGLAAIIGPLIGGQLAAFTDWRGIFLFLGAVGAVIFAASALTYRETLPPGLRTSGGLAQTRRDFAQLVSDRTFFGAALLTGFVNAALFAYLSGSTFVLQDLYGLSPQGYSLAFGLNSLGFMVFGFAAGRLAERWSERGVLLVGVVMCVIGAGGLLATGLLHLPLIAMVASLLTMVSGVAVTTPPSTSLAMADYPHLAGTASSLLGLARFAFGGLAAPLVGVGGPGTALPLGVVTFAACIAAGLTYTATMRRREPKPPRQPISAPHES